MTVGFSFKCEGHAVFYMTDPFAMAISFLTMILNSTHVYISMNALLIEITSPTQ
jgi:hypothetical protein